MFIRTELEAQLKLKADILEQMKANVNRLPTALEPYAHYWAISFDYIWIEFPLRPDLISTVRRILALAGWRLHYHYQSKETGDLRYRFHWRGDETKADSLLITFSATVEGSTCQLEKVGEKVVPLYKTICGGAK